MKNTFGKEEKLCNKILLSELFSRGNRFFLHPFKISWMVVDKRKGADIQAVIAVSKRNFKNAVHRNRIKRLVREAYRLNKGVVFKWFNDDDNDKSGDYNKTNADNVNLDSEFGKSRQLLLSISYIGKTIPEYSDVETKIILILRRLKKEYEKNYR